eukprot:TRINITY_DN563_c0_g3_i5.p1 TRINITY_DN563_c0_g3~~TRINITY_DN563_c0_g3_i5.p1  ORF type:complete len:112 (-),score=22.65 TRINITY_DN563_c0_g3_i5:623-958(-)
MYFDESNHIGKNRKEREEIQKISKEDRSTGRSMCVNPTSHRWISKNTIQDTMKRRVTSPPKDGLPSVHRASVLSTPGPSIPSRSSRSRSSLQLSWILGSPKISWFQVTKFW